MFLSKWEFVLDTKNEKNAKVVMGRIFKALNLTPTACEYSYYKKSDFIGFKVSVQFSHPIADWNLLVLTVINLGQKLGNSWYIGGDMFHSPTAVMSKNSAHISISGLWWVSWDIERPNGM